MGYLSSLHVSQVDSLPPTSLRVFLRSLVEIFVETTKKARSFPQSQKLPNPRASNLCLDDYRSPEVGAKIRDPKKTLLNTPEVPERTVLRRLVHWHRQPVSHLDPPWKTFSTYTQIRVPPHVRANTWTKQRRLSATERRGSNVASHRTLLSLRRKRCDAKKREREGEGEKRDGRSRSPAIPGIRFGIFLCVSRIVRIVLQAGH